MSWKWFRGSGKHREAAFIQDEGGNYIGKAYGHSGQRVEENARLMAASPRMLAALEQAELFISGFEDDESQDGIVELLVDIRGAITRATGKDWSEP